MKTQTITLLLSAVLLTAGCKKEKETQTLLKTMESFGETTTYEYNDNNQIVKTSSTNGFIDIYTYGANKVNVTTTIPLTNGGGENHSIINLRSDGKIVLYSSDMGDTYYTYGSDGLLQKTVSPWNTTVYEWSNGNIVTETSTNANDTSITVYTHYTDKENQLSGKYTGATWGPHSKNLNKSRTITYSGNTDVFEYSYTFDNEGRVASRFTKINGTDNPSSTIAVTYY